MADAKRLWYMRDNHLFRELPLDVEQACEAVRKEFAAGFTYGMLCATGSAADDFRMEHAGGELAEFLPRAREWLVYQIGYRPPGELEYQSWITALAATSAAASGQAAVQEVQPVAWVRVHPDGSYTNEYLPNAVIEDVRKRSGAWVPLAPATSQPSAQTDDALEVLRELVEVDDLKRAHARSQYQFTLHNCNDDQAKANEALVECDRLAAAIKRREGPARDRARKLVKGGAA